jgi:basic membrane protein A and related proteins
VLAGGESKDREKERVLTTHKRNMPRKAALPVALALVIAVGFALVGAGCGSSDNGGSLKQGSVDKIAGWGLQSPETNPFDKGGADGLNKAASILGAKANFLSNITFDQSPQVIERLVRDGYPVLVANGSGFADAMLAAAPKHPDVWFWVYSDLASTKGNPNVVGIRINWSEMGYLAAAIACQSAPSKKIGLVVAQPIPAYTHAVGGAVQGAQAACGNKNNMLVTWTGTFDDNAKTKDATQALISKGAEVIFDLQDAATVGVQSALKENPKIKYVGTTFPSTGLPNQIITSVVNDFNAGYAGTAQKMKDKTLKPQVYIYGVKDGGLVLTKFTNVSPAIAAEGMKTYDSLKTGSVVVDKNLEVKQ